MSGEALYERYKDALRRGHVASLRGRLEEALTAYAEAAAIAPERPTPHTSAGAALMRRKRHEDALRHYGAALRLAGQDEPALLGRAQALVSLGRPGEAADTLDTLAEARAAAGRLADAVDAARRGLELAEGRERRRMLDRLIKRLRASEPGEPGRLALEQALQVLDGGAVVEPGGRGTGTARPGGPAEAAPDGGGVPREAAAGRVLAPSREVPGSPAPAADSHQEGVDRDLPDDLDLEALAREADDAIEAGQHGPAVRRLVDLAEARRRAGELDSALDACYLGLSVAPDNVELHLALARLWDDRGWTALAAEKLDLLERLVTLDEDEDGIARIAAARARPR